MSSSTRGVSSGVILKEGSQLWCHPQGGESALVSSSRRGVSSGVTLKEGVCSGVIKKLIGTSQLGCCL